jgi:putative FmdB family regulatory protein
MPIYEFECAACGSRFEELVALDAAAPPCPKCGAPEPRRMLSQVFPSAKVGLRGEAARRSNATRRDREERRREGWQRSKKS